MSQKVAIVGVGQTVHAPERRDVDVSELLLEAIDEALDDAGLGLGDIENAVTSCMDFLDGRTIANMSVAEVVGSYLKSEARICADGTSALLYEWARIATEGFRIGLVTAHCKESGGNLHDIEVAATDPFTQRRLDFDGDAIAGLAARLVYDGGEISPNAAAAAVVESRRRGRSHPKVADLPEVTADEVLNAAVLADPLTILDKAPQMDGACAFVVVTADVANSLNVDPIWMTGMATMTGDYWSDGDLTSLSTLAAARRRAIDQADWGSDPADVAELSAQYSFQLIQYAREFGFDPADPALNPSGGWLGGSPSVVTGAARVAEAVYQLRGTAGDRQVGGCERALAHGVTGLGAQSHGVIALERSR
ncbi:MAG: thiolase family protein [Gemmatimonadetes bacterium]|nr:thiolase family protein [Gemmatimonadota bacterium]